MDYSLASSKQALFEVPVVFLTPRWPNIISRERERRRRRRRKIGGKISVGGGGGGERERERGK